MSSRVPRAGIGVVLVCCGVLVRTGQSGTASPPASTPTGPNTQVGLHRSSLNPLQVAGANIWVTNAFSNSVSKLRASDGATLGTFAVGYTPRGLAFDGANIWVADEESSTVTKLASNGTTLGTFTVGHAL